MYDLNNLGHVSVTYEMDLNLHLIERTVYTSLDWLGDVGGLMSVLINIGSFVLVFLSGNGLHYMLLTKIFKKETSGSRSRNHNRAEGYNARLK